MFSHWMSSAAASAVATAAAAAAAASAAAANNSSNGTTSTPPADVLLEVGPPPYVRYAAHAALLSAHSGYLRSALRTTPPAQQADAAAPIIYLANITADQFGPLLSYMYTGYLDLTVDNIFAVLLATHVLHMPRAADICRAFLTRSSSTSSNASQYQLPTGSTSIESTPLPPPSSSSSSSAPFGCRPIIRPIASKATPAAGGITVQPFVAPSQLSARLLLPSRDTPFKALLQQIQQQQRQHQQPPLVADEAHRPTVAAQIQPVSNTDVFTVKRRRRSSSSPQMTALPSADCAGETEATANHCSKSATSAVTIGEVLEHPVRFNDTIVPALKQQQLHTGSSSKKTIIDIASCDGPVRFRRVLNEAYGLPASSAAAATQHDAVERNAQLVANSFRLQMAKNISGEMRWRQQQQTKTQAALLLHSEENDGQSDANDDESDSQLEINVSSEATNPEPPAPSPTVALAAARRLDEQLYVCVYCKHTFKSQYCFQKHAKRHINPLTIDDSEVIVQTVLDAANDAAAEEANAEPNTSDTLAHCLGPVVARGSSKTTTTTATAAATAMVRREVRPLDMNVQYYPCKTCGSKFPSYYFVHKHRKLCHANEEN